MFSLKYLTTTVLSTSLLVLPAVALPAKFSQFSPTFLAQAQFNTPEALAIDKLFSADAAPPGSSSQNQRLFISVKNWMGAYQGVQPEGNNYLIKFERGLLPVSVRVDGKGEIKSLSVGCPRSTSLNLNQASTQIREMLSRCPGLQN